MCQSFRVEPASSQRKDRYCAALTRTVGLLLFPPGLPVALHTGWVHKPPQGVSAQFHTGINKEATETQL